jgi:hypothetical protein
MNYIYNPARLIQSISENQRTNAGHRENNNILNDANALHYKINACKNVAVTAFNKGVSIKYMPIVEQGFYDFSANPIGSSDYYPDFSQHERNYLETQAYLCKGNYPRAGQKHQCSYQLARASRSFPEFNVAPSDPIESRREAIKDALCFMAYVLNATIELPYYHNLLNFYDNKFDDKSMDTLTSSMLRRVELINSKGCDKHKAYKSIIFGELYYDNEDSAIPVKSSLKPYGVRELSLIKTGYDPKSNTVLDASSVNEILPLFNLVSQSHIRLPVALLATVCSEHEIRDYYSGLHSAANYGMQYNLNESALTALTLKYKDSLNRNQSEKTKGMSK